MSAVNIKTKVEVVAEITFNEGELRALDAMTGYGIEPFLKVFYEKLGAHYMRPYEQNLRELFVKINQTVPAALNNVVLARQQLAKKT